MVWPRIDETHITMDIDYAIECLFFLEDNLGGGSHSVTNEASRLIKTHFLVDRIEILAPYQKYHL